MARFVQQHDILAVGDPLACQLYPHPPPQRLGIQQPARKRLWNEEATDCSARERTLLP